MAELLEISALCLACGAAANQVGGRGCPACGSRRIIRHAELFSLTIAHVDCDAFYASIEKRDDPSLADRPVIVGGGVRGVVTTACYIARTYGVRSAMPMFEARRLCPAGVIVKPNFEKYSAAAREVRRLMEELTPAVEPVSIDEAFLDLSGTSRLHKHPPAAALARLQGVIKAQVGITVSVGLSCNKFLAKIASDLEKPHGFSVIGLTDAKERLAPMPVSAIWGVGAVFAKRLNDDGFRKIADLQKIDASILARRYGDIGVRIASLSHGLDYRKVKAADETKSVSAETTFNKDLTDIGALENQLWRLCERVALRTKARGLLGETVTLKLKTSSFRTITRRTTLKRPSNLARTLFDAARPLLAAAAGGQPFRLIGVGYCGLSQQGPAIQNDLFGAGDEKKRKEELAIDAIREKFGDDAIALGRTYAIKGAGKPNQPKNPRSR